MDDQEIDALLAAGDRPGSPSVDAAVTDLVRRTRAEVLRTAGARSPRRRRMAVGVAVLGAVVLTAGGTLTAAELHVPPFQTLEPGVQRVQEPVPVDYTIDTGKDVHCQAFLEFRNLTGDQLAAARTYVAHHDWSGFGQRAYAAAERRAAHSSDSVESALAAVLDDEFADLAPLAVPGVSVHHRSDEGPTYNGNSMSCPTGQR